MSFIYLRGCNNITFNINFSFNFIIAFVLSPFTSIHFEITFFTLLSYILNIAFIFWYICWRYYIWFILDIIWVLWTYIWVLYPIWIAPLFFYIGCTPVVGYICCSFFDIIIYPWYYVYRMQVCVAYIPFLFSFWILWLSIHLLFSTGLLANIYIPIPCFFNMR